MKNMPLVPFARGTVWCLAFIVASSSVSLAQAPPPAVNLSLDVDAHEAPRGVLHVHEHIAVRPGPLTLVYPKWIPGEHMPAGPIVDAGGFTIVAGGTTLPWRRDLDDSYAIHLTVPPGAGAIDVGFDFLGAGIGRYSENRLATTNLLTLTWHKVLLVPQVDDYRTIQIAPTLQLPGADWSVATALDVARHDGATVTFAPVTMEQLIDSPVDAGTVSKRWSLGSIDGAPVELAAFADTPDELDVPEARVAKLRAMVAQMGALYRARHFNHYTFLLTMSDAMPGNGVEHHQSSDNGTGGDFLTDDDAFAGDADLLPHEFNHSWDGKYRRPAGLATPNLTVPMHDDLLWVYEGMTQYYGIVQATRSGMQSVDRWRQRLARTYARYDVMTGRRVRPLQDTADMAAILYDSPRGFYLARRGTDFYDEGALMWLEADGIIRRRTNGAKSLDDVARAFFGGSSTGPIVVPYVRADVVAALDAVAPYDWAGFFAARVDAIAPHPPDPFTAAGWRVVYKPTRSEFEKSAEARSHGFDATFSLGFSGNGSGVVSDVVEGSPAALAGIGPGMKIVAIDDRAIRASVRAQLDPELVAAQHGDGRIRLLLLQDGVYREVTLTYRGGPRYPDLERIPGTTDLLTPVATPLRATPARPPAL